MKYFTFKEMIQSDTAKSKDIENIPNWDQINALMNLIKYVLDPLRSLYKKAIRVSSGFRSEALNEAVNGSKTSQHCLDRTTEVLTNNGWKNINTICETDQVFSLNLNSGKLEQVEIESIIKYPFEGNLYYGENKHVEYAVTDEHRMVVRYDAHKYKKIGNRNITENGQNYFDSLKTDNDKFHIELAKDIHKKRRIFKVAGISANNNTYDLNVLRMCMAVISDGYVIRKKGKFGGFGFNLKKERDKNELEDILQKLKWKYTKNYSINHEKSGQSDVYTYYINTQTAMPVYEIIGELKRIPRWFLSLNPDILKQLVLTYAKFDGSFDKRENNSGVTIFSKDEWNIDMLQAMSVLSDMRCVKKKLENVTIKIKDQESTLKEFYNLYITQNKNESRMNETPGHQRKFYYKSDVWCVNNKNTTLVTRRNGKVVILGNCKGEAADITAGSKKANMKLFELIRDNLTFDQLIDESDYSWIHVSFTKNNRNQILHLK